LQILTNPTHGSLGSTAGVDSKYYQLTDLSYTGADSFTYQACDNHGACSSAATVSISVVNQAPNAVGHSYTVHGMTNIIGPLLAGASDPEGDTITLAAIVTNPTHGSIGGYDGNKVMYSLSDRTYTGNDSFVYKVCDYYNACTTANGTITIVNQSPVAIDHFYVVHGSSGNIGPLLQDDYDPEQDTISLNSYPTYPTHGQLAATGIVGVNTYTPNAGFNGLDSFTYKICDYYSACNTGNVYIYVTGNDAPLGPPHACNCPEDPHGNGGFNPLNGAFSGASVSAAGSSGPSAGDPVNLANGRETYTPAADLTIYNPSGPSVVWQRSYLGYQALSGNMGYWSPGLARGWVHNFDVTIQGGIYSWAALKLIYPNGTSENLTPLLDANGQPTGVLTTPPGSPYLASGVPSATKAIWQSLTITWKDQTKWTFTRLSSGTYTLSQITNRTGQSINFNWRSDRALSQITDASLGTVLLSMTYGSTGKLLAATDVYGRKVTYTILTPGASEAATLQSVSQVVTAGTTNPPAHWSYTYTTDGSQQLNTITVPSPTGTGNSTSTINYGQGGKVSSLVDANGNQRVYTYGSNSTQVQVKDAANNVAMTWTQKFNTNRLDTGIIDAANRSTLMEYNDSTNPYKSTRIVDKNSHSIIYTYDQYGNVRTITTPRNVVITYTWDYATFALGRLRSVQEGSKPATTLTYFEPSGLVQSITSPAPSGSGLATTTTSYTYDTLGNVLTAIGPGNNSTSQMTTTFNYTTDGTFTQPAKIRQPLAVTDNLGHATHLRYDSQGRVTSIVDALGYETDTSYNIIEQPDTITLPATGQTGTGRARRVNSYLYAGGPLMSVTAYDESSVQVQQVSRVYGLEGELLSVSGGVESVTNGYDALYRLKTLSDGNGNTTTYSYNNAGYLQSVLMPGNEIVQFPSYDSNGNVLQRIDGNGVVTNYLYTDPESRLTDVQYPATPNLNVHLVYDGYGRRSSVSDGTGVHSYAYGNLNEIGSVTTTYTGLPAQVISYTYYPNGTRQTMSTPAGNFNYSYDGAGRSSSMTNPFSETTSWTYYDNNWLQTQTLGNTASASYTYNAQGQLTRLLNQASGSTLSDFSSMTYDGAGNRKSITTTSLSFPTLNGTISYTYDSKNQVKQEQSTRNGGYNFGFDYDLAGNPLNFKGTSKSYNLNNQQTGTGFAHDNNGNPTTYSGLTMMFDPENRLTSYGSALTAQYRADSLRAWKQGAGGRTYFIYDGSVPVVELDASGNVTATNSFGSKGLTSRRLSGTSTFYTFDQQGSVPQRLDSSGNVLAIHLFSAHGSSLGSTITDPFGYKAQWGYYTDGETGLQLLTHRYYDPETGRFLTRDPISYRGGINLYAYVGNDPVNYRDPSGFERLSTYTNTWPPHPDYSSNSGGGGSPSGDGRNALLIAGGIVMVGGGPEDPAADIAAAGYLIIALVMACNAPAVPVEANPPGKVIPFPTPDDNPLPPPKPPSGRCNRIFSPPGICRYLCPDGQRYDFTPADLGQGATGICPDSIPFNFGE
jgi:RHS repeat-associated protein